MRAEAASNLGLLNSPMACPLAYATYPPVARPMTRTTTVVSMGRRNEWLRAERCVPLRLVMSAALTVRNKVKVTTWQPLLMLEQADQAFPQFTANSAWSRWRRVTIP